VKQNIIKKLSDREHILLKKGMYIGSSSLEAKELLVMSKNGFEYETISYIPGLLKIIDEIIDNSVDEAIRTNFNHATNIGISYSDGEITVTDNGRGVPITPGHDNIPQAVIAFTEARAGSNFSDDTKANGIGTNGVGSYLTNVFSSKFKVTTQDGSKKLTLVSINNAEKYDYEIKESKEKSGTTVKFTPDYKLFGITELNEDYFKVIENRLFHLAQSFQKV
jgi:DNA gyrase/topoisomerase IV subunit B